VVGAELLPQACEGYDMIASSIHESLFETMLREMASTGTSLSDSVSSQTEDSRYGEISIYQVGDTELWRFRSSL
jgi:hypothetical protein